jgi:hypothetical protein
VLSPSPITAPAHLSIYRYMYESESIEIGCGIVLENNTRVERKKKMLRLTANHKGTLKTD